MNADFNVKVAQCPGCGAPLEFKVGASLVVVCESCHYAVARGDRGLEKLGKVADLVPTGAKITLGIDGRLQNVGFRVVGRTQLQWAQGVWDEWYIVLDHGKWGWLAEAQGRYYLSFKVADRPTPAWSSLRPGKTVPLGELGQFVASDLKRAKYVTAAGELPERIPLDGVNIRTADLSGDKGAFATLDYGAEGDEADVYVGREVPFEELHLNPDKLAAPVKLERIKGQKLTCPKCNGPLELKLPDEAMRVTCPYCASLLDATQGKLQFLAELKKRTTEIPVGAKGNFDGVDYQIIGWLERTCTVEGIDYTWDEYLLYDEKSAGYRFLVNSAGHWSWVVPVPAGEVSEGSRGPLWKGTLFRRFASVQASVTGVKGEFYWAVALGESVTANDYVAPPQALSEERSEDEVNWSHAIYLTPEQVRAALKLPAALAAPRGVGMMQPNPWGESLGSMLRWLTVGSIAAIALYVALAARPSPVVFDQAFTPAVVPAPAGAPAAAEPGGEVPEPPPNQDVALDPARPENGTWRLSAPFRIEGARKNLEIDLESGVDNTWAGVAGALVNQATSEVTEFNLETSYYHGYEDGESWSEGSHSESAFISAVPPGEYVMRLESIWEPGKPAPQLHVKLTSGVARLLHLFLALLALGLLPALAIWRNGAFEKARWEESNID